MRTVYEECLDKLLMINERHLRQVMAEYVTHYTQSRPHQGIEQQTPIPFPTVITDGSVQRREVLVASFTNTIGRLLKPISGTDRVFEIIRTCPLSQCAE